MGVLQPPNQNNKKRVAAKIADATLTDKKPIFTNFSVLIFSFNSFKDIVLVN